MHLDPASLFVIPEGIETRWASAENPSGARGGACPSNDGRKRSSHVTPLKAGAGFTMAKATETSGTVCRIWVTIQTYPITQGKEARILFALRYGIGLQSIQLQFQVVFLHEYSIQHRA